MKIAIAQKNRPFSHQLGTWFLLPKTSWSVQVFPTRLNFANLEETQETFRVDFPWRGPLKEFTAQLDLESASLSVFGMTQEGYMRYCLEARGEGLWLDLDKAPGKKVALSGSNFKEKRLSNKESMLLVSCFVCDSLNKERLSLGSHKAQEWSRMKERFDFKELFPLWLQLSALVPKTPHRPIESLKEHKRVELLKAFTSFFLSTFKGVFVPRLCDEEHQGLPQEKTTIPLLSLLTESGRAIRSLFYQETDELILLPCLPPEFSCGRMVSIQTHASHLLHFEWTKKALRRVVLTPATDGEVHLRLPKGITACRLQTKGRVRSKLEVSKEGRLTLPLEQGSTLQLDRFLF